MPVGIPRVPYQFTEDEDSWSDLYNRLSRQRLLFLGQPVNTESANQIAALMIYLSMEDPSKDIYLFLNSPGGGVLPGMLIFDTMHFVQAEIQTVCMGLSASMSSLLLLGGEPTKRLAFAHSRIMIHQPRGAFLDEQLQLCDLESFEIMQMYDKIIDIYARKTGKTPTQVAEDMERDSYLSPEKAKEYGIIDMIAAGNY